MVSGVRCGILVMKNIDIVDSMGGAEIKINNHIKVVVRTV